ncbi:MAG: SDR family oxidoreductase [Chloroflexota bacterium]|nr:SDR family oxidoreductase [Chloroflexota bacterium]
MEMGIKGTVALVTASSQGIGKAIAIALGLEGAKVAMCARHEDELEVAASEVRGMGGGEVLSIVADLSREADIKRLVAKTAERFGVIDILVNNAGGPPPGEFVEQSDDEWQHAFDLNLMSTVRLIRETLPHMQKSGRGRIINLTSTSVKQPIEGLILSNSIRAAVVGMAKTLSWELAPYGITVNNIAPGRVSTARTKQLDEARAAKEGISVAEAHNLNVGQIPLGRYGTPQEVANMVVFLAADKSSYVTGTTISVDGGLTRSIF